jgi:hypothetical protein
VRRIDAIQVPYQSHRTVTVALKPNPGLPNDEPKKDTPESSPDTSGGPGMPGGPGGPGGKVPGGPGGIGDSRGGPGDMFSRGGMLGMGGANQAVNPTGNNGLDRNRYLHVTEQCRHLPFGLLLIVDQANIPDVLTALANSKLRIQITQVQFQHARGVQPAAGGSEPGAGGTAMGPMPPGAMGPTMGRPGMVRPGAGGGTPPGYGQMMERARGGRGDSRYGPMPPPPTSREGVPGAPGGFGPETAGMSEDDPNLVELGIYGIAALYERFPPKKKEPGADTSPGPRP